jgi:hypothetical protein
MGIKKPLVAKLRINLGRAVFFDRSELQFFDPDVGEV